MSDEPGSPGPGDAELKAALHAALAAPFDDVDWDHLHARIVADAERRVGAAPRRAYDWVAAWSARATPAAAAALAAAILSLLILPIERRSAEPQPPGFWPVAEVLVSNLPESTRRMLLAADDFESLLQAILADGGEERDIS
jgi:hypothetical protein